MWIRIEDAFADHRKFYDDPLHGAICQLIQIRALCWAGRYLTDGHLPAHIISKFLSGLEHVGITNGMQGFDAKDIDWADRMVEAKLWDKTSSGYRIHDYLEYNPSKKEYLEGLEKKRKAGQAGGQASATARAQASAQPHAQAKSKQNPTPYPYSDSVKKEKKDSLKRVVPTQLADRSTQRFELAQDGIRDILTKLKPQEPIS